MGVDRSDSVRNACVGRVLREVRKDAGLSCEQVEERSGGRFKKNVLGAYERGDRGVSLERMVELADFYEVDAQHLLLVMQGRMRAEVDDPPIDEFV